MNCLPFARYAMALSILKSLPIQLMMIYFNARIAVLKSMRMHIYRESKSEAGKQCSSIERASGIFFFCQWKHTCRRSVKLWWAKRCFFWQPDVCHRGLFQIFKDIDFGFMGDIVTFGRERIGFGECAFTVMTYIPSSFEINGALSVDQC